MRRVFYLGVLLIFAACSDWDAVTYEIPNGYVGRVVIEYGRSDCASERSGIPRVIVVSSAGKGCSKRKTAANGGWSRFYYVDASKHRVRELHSTGWGEGGDIWEEAGSADGRTHEFFIGSEQQYKATYEHTRSASSAKR